MKEDTIDELIADLMAECGFGTVIAPMEPVSGGLMHRMYRVKTDSGIYAVKHLNPEIMRREGVFENYRRAEDIEGLLEKETIPIVPAITVLGKKMQHVGGHYFYIFHWHNGHITDWNHISKEACRTAGNILGRMHAIDSCKVPHKEPKVSNVDWQEYVQKARKEKKEIAPILAENVQLFLYAERELNRARASLPDILCVSDEDMDPKNVMWEKGEPRVIDLECLDYGNPISHALQLALQWSGITTCSIDIEKLAAFFDGYLAVYDNGFRAYGGVFGLAYTWIEWLEYNMQRALGACADQAEQNLGISEVRNTVNRIKYIHSMEDEIKRALDSCLSHYEFLGTVGEKSCS